MLGSRLVVLTRVASTLNRKVSKQLVQPSRASHVWSYREPGPPPSKTIMRVTEGVAGLMWWWVLWHLWHEYSHITGEFDYPDVSKWTDEELGIPPDDEE